MEENTKKANEQPKQLSYDELKGYYGELQQQYQKLMMHYQECQQALNDRSMETTSFVLNALFRVMEHPNRYSEKFVNWVTNNIQVAVTTLVESVSKEPEGETKDSKNEG